MRGDLLALGVVGATAALGLARGSRSVLVFREWDPIRLRKYVVELGRYVEQHETGGFDWRWVEDGLGVRPEFARPDEPYVRIEMGNVIDPDAHGSDPHLETWTDVFFDIYLMVKPEGEPYFEMDEESEEQIYLAGVSLVDRGFLLTGDLETDARWLAGEVERYIAKHPPGWT